MSGLPSHAGPPRPLTAAVAVGALVASLLTPAWSIASEPAGGANASTLLREPLVSPQELGADTQTDLMYADPTEQLSVVAPPDPNNTGSAELDYPIVLPKGRGMTPDLSISYSSGGPSSWTGLGWDMSVGDVSVDTEFGVPLFCPRDTGPKCDDVESESYTLDGDPLLPSAVRASYLPRVAEREDFTGRVETQYRRIIRHGTNTQNYSWQVVDKEGAIKWYGGFPDDGGPFGDVAEFGENNPYGTRSGPSRNDKGCTPNANPCEQNKNAILFDDQGNAVRWYLSAERDVGVNFFRYQYDTVTYRAQQKGSGTTWTPLPDGTTCPATTVCARHVFLSKIFYTGVGQQDITPLEDPAYEIDFVHGDMTPDNPNDYAPRVDGVLDAKSGFLDLDQEVLQRIDVRYVKTGELISRYRLDYNTGRFGKTMLGGVTQVGCAGGKPDDCSSDPKDASAHEFSYFDDIAQQGTGFKRAEWNTVSDNLDNGRVVNRASALGMSVTNGGDGQIYVGFNPDEPDKQGSFGGSVSLEGATTESVLEFMDINGDGLPDKVFRDTPDLVDPGNTGNIKYRLNTSTPGADLSDPVTFSSTAHLIGDPGDDVNRLPLSHSFGISGGIEAYFGIIGVFNVGGSWDFADSYFNDVNNDGLPDFVKGTQVLFNHLDCSSNGGSLADAEKCIPTFSPDDSQTRVPLTVQSVPVSNDDLANQLQQLRELAPPVDTLRRWVAPFTGDVAIDATATLLAPPGGEALGGQQVGLSVQQNHTPLDGTEIAAASLAGVGDSWHLTKTIHVDKGDRLYFRVKARRDGKGDDVAWDQTITYPGFSSSPDVNGLDQHAYVASDDFTLAGRPGALMSLPDAGTGRFTGAIDKGATTDDVTPRVQVTPHADPSNPVDATVDVVPITAAGAVDVPRVKTVTESNGQWCVSDSQTPPVDFGCFGTQAEAHARTRVLGAAETGLFRFEAQFPLTALDSQTGKADQIGTWLQVDSPIDVAQITWVQQPVLCYMLGSGCDPDKTNLSPPVDIDIYPTNNLTAPATAWTSTLGRSVTPSVGLDVGAGNGAGDVILTVKQPDGYVYKTPIHVDTDGTLTPATLPDLTLAAGEDYWFDLSVRSPALSEKLSNPTVTLKYSQNGTDKQVDVPVTLNSAGQQGIFPLGYRGWGYAGYRAEGSRASEPVHEDDFRIGPAGGGTYKNKDDACKAQPTGCITSTDGMGFPADYPVDANGRAKIDLSSAKDQIPLTFAYLPILDKNLEASWQVVDDKPRLLGRASMSRSGRLADLPAMPGSGPGVSAPALWGSAGPVFTFMTGIGPAEISFAFGWTTSVIDYMDMNGDGYPDIVTPNEVTFTNPRGGRGCIKNNALEACKGAGPTVVQEGLTLSAGLGLGGAPIGIESNSKGVANATQGNSSTKGGSASSSTKGGELGVAIGASASFSNFSAPNPSYGDDLGKIPDTTLKDSTTAPTQQLLADLNGDGLPDRVKVSPQGVFVKFNYGYSYAPIFVQWTQGAFDSNESYSGSLGGEAGFQWANYGIGGGVSGAAGVDFSRNSWEDVNGDGILDALFKNESDHTVKVAFGTGTGVGPADANYKDTAKLPFDVFPGIQSDVSGATIRQDSAESVGGGVDVEAGIPLCIALCFLIISGGGHFENSLGTTDVEITDVNGDGFADSVSRIPLPRTDTSGNHERLDVLLNTTGRTGLLKQVTTPMGGRIDLDYDRQGNTVEHPESMWVMSDVTVKASRGNDGVADQHSAFTYEHPTFSFVHRADLGFEKVVERQLDTRAASPTALRSIEHVYLNDSVFDAGLETDTTTYDGDVAGGVKVSETKTDWRIENLETGLPLVTDGVSTDDLLQLRAAPLVAEVTQTIVNRSGDTPPVVTQQETVTDYEYDDLGNPTVIEDRGDPANPSDDVVARIRYSDCTIAASWDLNVAFGCADGFAAPNPDADPPPDPNDATDVNNQPVPAKAKPEAASPFWSANLCPTWTSVPVTFELRDAGDHLLRYRDARTDVCNNTSVTYVQEMIEEGKTIEDSTFAVTQLTYDKYGSYDRIVYPEDANGLHYAVHYVYDEERGADVARITDLSLDDTQVADFLELDSMVKDSVVDWIAGLPDESVGITSTATFDPLSGRVASRTDANGNTTSPPKPVGHTTHYTYDPLGRTQKITFPDGGWVSFDYAPSNGQYPYAVAHNYDEFATGPDNTIDTATFVDGSGRVTGRKRDAEFFVAPDVPTTKGWAVEGRTELDALGRVVKEWFPTRQTTGALTDYWDKTPAVPSTNSTTTWDSLDRVREEKDVAGHVTKTDYSFAPLAGVQRAAMTVTDPLGRKTVTWTDVHDNVVAVDDIATDLGLRRTSYDTDALGQLHAVDSPGGGVIENTFDLLGQRLSTSTPDGGLTNYTYDPAGNVVAEETPRTRALTGPEGTAILNEYEFGHLVKTTYPDDTPDVEFTWGGYGRTDAGDNGAGQIVGVLDGAKDQILGYDENGRADFEDTTMLGRHPNSGPWTTSYDQDWLGRLRTVTLPDGPGGSGGEIVTNGYDSGGRLNRVTGAKTCTDLGTLTAAIDATQTSITVTEHTTSAPALPFVIQIDGEQLSVVDRQPTGNPEVWTYTVVRGINGTPPAPTNAAHALGASVTTLVAVTCAYRYLDTRQYDEFGVQAFQQVGNGIQTTTSREPDTRRLSQITSKLAGTTRLLQNQQYTYDAVGNLRKAVNALPQDLPSLFGGPSTQNYSYDGRYRLKHADGTWDYEPSLQRKYAFDATYDDVTGNMTSAVQVDRLVNLPCKGKACDGTIQTGTSYSHSSMTYDTSGAHQYDVLSGSLTLSNNKVANFNLDYSYDADGNVSGVVQPDNIREVTWDAADRMTKIVDHNPNNTGRKETSYVYDYNGELALEVKEQGQTSFVNPWFTVRNGTMLKHIWAGQDRLATKFAQTDAFEQRVYFLHKDLQGSTNIATDRTGKVFQHHEYFPTGQVWVDESSTIFRTPYQFGGGYTDEDHHLINFGQRWYDPGSSSFMSVDPALTHHPGAIVDSPELALSYTYARNNPLTYVDSNGQKFTPVQSLKMWQIRQNLTIDGKEFIDGTPATAQNEKDFDAFFDEHQGRRGRMALYWLSRQEEGHKRQEFAEKFGAKTWLQFDFEDGKLSTIKAGVGFGPRLKKEFSKPAVSTATNTPSGAASQTQSTTSSTRSALTSASKANPTMQGNQNAAAAQPISGSGTSPPQQPVGISGHRLPATSTTSSGGGVGQKNGT
jgi:RHS repeat-associated protein